MSNNSNYGKDYLLQPAYSKYLGNKVNSQKSKFEDTQTFRSGLSIYDMRSQGITPGSNCLYDHINCSGVPIDYDATSKHLYVDGSDSHTLLIGATGSKKSRLVVMPTVRTLTAAQEDMVICDPKGEIYHRSAAYLKQCGYTVHAINLREPIKGDGWNILQLPYVYYLNDDVDKACALINDITVSLVPLQSKDPYWDMSARDLLFGLVILLFQICKDKKLPSSFVSMRGLLKLREELFSSTYSSVIMESALWVYARKYDLVRMRLNGIVICPDKTLACILSTFDQHMSCFSMQPQIVDLLSKSTFELDHLGFSKMAIFLIMPDEKTTYHKIITIFVKQIYEYLIDSAFRRTKENRFVTRINFLLDEFSSLPYIADFPQMISASRSRNIRFILVVQSKHQLIQRYEHETETIISNCNNWMFLTSRETELLREISELGGTTGNAGEALISMSWLQHLDKEKGECLIFCGRKYPYLATLPDIDVYDNAHFDIQQMPVRTPSTACSAFSDNHYFSNIVAENSDNLMDLSEADEN